MNYACGDGVSILVLRLEHLPHATRGELLAHTADPRTGISVRTCELELVAAGERLLDVRSVEGEGRITLGLARGAVRREHLRFTFAPRALENQVFVALSDEELDVILETEASQSRHAAGAECDGRVEIVDEATGVLARVLGDLAEPFPLWDDVSVPLSFAVLRPAGDGERFDVVVVAERGRNVIYFHDCLECFETGERTGERDSDGNPLVRASDDDAGLVSLARALDLTWNPERYVEA